MDAAADGAALARRAIDRHAEITSRRLPGRPRLVISVCRSHRPGRGRHRLGAPYQVSKLNQAFRLRVSASLS